MSVCIHARLNWNGVYTITVYVDGVPEPEQTGSLDLLCTVCRAWAIEQFTLQQPLGPEQIGYVDNFLSLL